MYTYTCLNIVLVLTVSSHAVPSSSSSPLALPSRRIPSNSTGMALESMMLQAAVSARSNLGAPCGVVSKKWEPLGKLRHLR